MEIMEPEQYEEYEQFAQTHPSGNFMQSVNWAKVKSNWKHAVVVHRDESGAITGGMSILIMPMGAGALMYAPHGPLCDYTDKAVLADLLDGAREVGRKYHAHLLKMDPYIIIGEEQEREKTDAFRSLGCTITEDAGFKDTIQPRYNYMLPYIKGLTPDELLARFERETRYYIRYPQKKGVVCKNVGLDGLDDFYRIYSQTGDRQGFSVRPKEYLARFFTAFPDKEARLYMCYYEDKPLCGGIAMQYAGKTAHVYGCSTDEMRNLRPTYLLQWALMNWALEGGCWVYDMQGIAIHKEDSEALYNVWGFKQNFTGEVVTTVGEFELVLRPGYNKMMNLAMKTRKALKKH